MKKKVEIKKVKNEKQKMKLRYRCKGYQATKERFQDYPYKFLSTANGHEKSAETKQVKRRRQRRKADYSR